MKSTHLDVAIFLVATLFLILLMGGFIITIIFLYRKRQISFARELEQMKLDYEKGLLSTQLEIQEQTLQHVSRDIHDNINLNLTLAKLNLNTLQFKEEARAEEQLNGTILLLSKAIEDLTDISRTMNSDVIAERGLIAAVEQELEKLQRLDHFQIRFGVVGEPQFLDTQKELVMFRIIQEGFNNILKHSRARTVDLELRYLEGRRVEIGLRDDGVGFLPPPAQSGNGRRGTGLGNMQKRASLLNGTFTLTSQPGQGTSITITIPY